MNVLGFGLILFVGAFIVATAVSLIKEFFFKKDKKPPDEVNKDKE